VLHGDTEQAAGGEKTVVVSVKSHQNEPPRKPENIKAFLCFDSVSEGGFFMSESKQEYLTVEEVCNLLHVSKPTLCRWRKQGRGPAYLKMGPTSSAIVYPHETLDEWIHANTIIPQNH
jgi:excisionase family DNA binding protein